MNLYLVSRIDRADYDEYENFVVVTNTEEEARYMSPSEHYVWKNSQWYFKYFNGVTKPHNFNSWVNPSHVDVKLIGVADSSLSYGEVVCSSFNAG